MNDCDRLGQIGCDSSLVVWEWKWMSSISRPAQEDKANGAEPASEPRTANSEGSIMVHGSATFTPYRPDHTAGQRLPQQGPVCWGFVLETAQ